MADASVHIHIDTPVDMAKIDALLSAAIDAKGIDVQTRVPEGYRCAICFRADGGHQPTCTVQMPAGIRGKVNS